MKCTVCGYEKDNFLHESAEVCTFESVDDYGCLAPRDHHEFVAQRVCGLPMIDLTTCVCGKEYERHEILCGRPYDEWRRTVG